MWGQVVVIVQGRGDIATPPPCCCHPLVLDNPPPLSMTPFSPYSHVLHQKPGLVVDPPHVVDAFALSTTRNGGGRIHPAPNGIVLVPNQITCSGVHIPE